MFGHRLGLPRSANRRSASARDVGETSRPGPLHPLLVATATAPRRLNRWAGEQAGRGLSGGMRGGVAVRRFGGFSQGIPQGGGLVGRGSGWRPPPEPVGKYAQIHATGLAQEVLDVCVPVRVRIAPARCLTGWTRDGWDCPGGPASAGSSWVSGGFFSDLQEVPLGRSAHVWRAWLRIAAGLAGGARDAGGRRRWRNDPGGLEVKQSPGRQEVRLSPAGRR
jgi:hypothetical protein